MEKIRVGFAMTGSFCTFSQVVPVIEQLVNIGYDVTPIMSGFSYSTDTRFGKAEDWINQIEQICGKQMLHSIEQAEPIGPKALLDVLVIAPCTGNTLGKLANGITDTSVTMAAKAHLRNASPLIIAVSTNDALGSSAKNIGLLLNSRNVYFVPMSQDDPIKKPASLVANFSRIPLSVECALKGVQIQPVLF